MKHLKIYEDNWWDNENDPFEEETKYSHPRKEKEKKKPENIVVDCKHDYQYVNKTVYSPFSFIPMKKYYRQCTRCKKIEKEYLETPTKIIDRWGDFK